MTLSDNIVVYKWICTPTRIFGISTSRYGCWERKCSREGSFPSTITELCSCIILLCGRQYPFLWITVFLGKQTKMACSSSAKLQHCQLFWFFLCFLQGSRGAGKVHSFGKRDHAIKRNLNIPVVVRGWLYKQVSRACCENEKKSPPVTRLTAHVKKQTQVQICHTVRC